MGKLLLDPTSGAHLRLGPETLGVLLLGVPEMAERISNGRLSIDAGATLENVLDDGTVISVAPQELSRDYSIDNGTGAGQADRAWKDEQIEITSGTSVVIDVYDLANRDLNAGPGRDALGQVQTWAEIMALIVLSDPNSAGELYVGGEGSAAAFSAPFDGDDTAKAGPYGPNGAHVAINPADPAWVVEDGANHLLALEARNGDVTAAVLLLPRSG